MKPIKNWKDITPSGDRERLKAGGYIIKITDVKDVPKKEYLEILYDIAEGPEAGRFKDDFYADKPYAHRFIRSYKDSAAGMFKAFINAVEASNEGWSWDACGWKEQALVGKIAGVVLREEEYRTNRGDVNTRLGVYSVIDAERVRTGDYTVPDVKPLKEDEAPAEASTGGFSPAPDVPFAQLSDADIPF